MPWPDCKTASKLCVGGVCMYKLKPGCGLSNEWLVEHVTPAIQHCFGSGVAEILARPLLWACIDEACASMVPEHIRIRILNALQSVSEQSSLEAGENCVEKVLTIVSEVEGQVCLDEVSSQYTAAVAGTGAGGSDTEWKNMMYAKVTDMARDIKEVKDTQASHHAETNRRMHRMDQNVSRVGMFSAGARVQTVGGGGRARGDKPAQLSACPKNLYVLWAEYESGIGGNKAARLFTPVERGAVKFKYCRRRIAWGVIENMVNRSIAADVAIDTIYQECGGPNTRVNAVINKLKVFRRIGNPQLHMDPQ